MTTIGESLLIQAFQSLLVVHGRTLTCPAGEYAAVVETVPQISPDGELGNDPREFVVASFLKSKDPAMSHSDQVTEEQSDGSTLTYRVRGKENAPGEPTVKYTLEKAE